MVRQNGQDSRTRQAVQDGYVARPGGPALLTAPQRLARRVRDMLLVWLAFGAVSGVCTAPAGGWVGLVSGALAGMIVLPPLGAVLGLLGGRRGDSLVCGAAGLALGAVTGAAGAGTVSSAAAFGLITGGLVGATFVAFFYRLPRLLVGRLAARA